MPIGWLSSFSFFGLGVAVVVIVLLVRNQSRRTTEAAQAAELEAAVQTEIARVKMGGAPPDWSPPTLPWSVMAGIWTHRLVDTSTPSVYGKQGDPAVVGWSLWNRRREPAYVIAAALLSVREVGLIQIEVSPEGRFLSAWDRVRLQLTGAAPQPGAAPLVEGKLMLAFDDLGQKWFGKTTAPSMVQLVRTFLHEGPSNSYKWVMSLVTQDAVLLGLCEPELKGRQPAYSIPRLAACEYQVAAFVSRWKELAGAEPEIVQRLVGEANAALYGRVASSGA